MRLRERVAVASVSSPDQAREGLRHLSRWRTRAGVLGRVRGDRLTLTVPPPTRALLIPVLVARLSERDGRLVATGRIRPSLQLVMPFLLPAMALLGAVLIPDGRPFLAVFAGGVLTLIGLEIRWERERYRVLVETMQQGLRDAMDSDVTRR